MNPTPAPTPSEQTPSEQTPDQASGEQPPPTPPEVAEPVPSEAAAEPTVDQAQDEPAPAEPAPAEPAPAAPARPVPRPPGPRPVPRPAPPKRPGASPAPVVPTPALEPSDSATWGRVDSEGAVFVRTRDGERQVGQWPDGDPEEVLALFARKYDALAFEVGLLEQRVKAGTASPEDAGAALKQIRPTLDEAAFVGDTDALAGRVSALETLIKEQRERRRAERAEKVAAARTRKEELVSEAETLAAGENWRSGADRLRALLDEWKSLPRLDKAADDALWRRFSSARTTYTRHRKAHFAELDEKREGARVVKERLVTEAEKLSGSTEWGPTAGAYRDLMRRWKAAGPAPRDVEEDLWRRFRAAQDTFFGARDAEAAATDAEFAANATVKEAILVKAEALVPVKDVAAAKSVFRDLADQWDEAGKVPRERIKELEGRMRTVEKAIRDVEDQAWQRSNPEARARAADTVAQLEASLADLESKRATAEAAGNDRKAAEHAAAIEARSAWLAQAQKALTEFS